MAGVKKRERFAAVNLHGPMPGHHVGAAVRAVNIEKSQNGDGQSPDVGVAMSEEFHGTLAGGIGRKGPVGGGGFGERHRRGLAINRTGGGEQAMRFADLPGGIEKIQRSLHVDAGVNERVIDAVTHGGHGGDVGNGVGFEVLKQIVNHIFIAQIADNELEIFMLFKIGKITPLVDEGVKIVHVVQAGDMVATGEEAVCEA